LNQLALRKSFKHKTISGSALDVYESEPPDDLEFLALPYLMVTLHIWGNANGVVLAMRGSAIRHLK
jgi:phosphoglycerate dehydrogenase-like enzyme